MDMSGAGPTAGQMAPEHDMEVTAGAGREAGIFRGRKDSEALAMAEDGLRHGSAHRRCMGSRGGNFDASSGPIHGA